MLPKTKPPLATLGWLLLLLLLLGVRPLWGADPLPTRFTLHGEPTAGAVFVAGEFNGWNTSATPLRREGAGDWSVDVPLSPGHYAYKFIVDGRWQTDPAATESAEDGLGGQNSVRLVVAAPPAAGAAAPAPVVAARSPSPVGRWTTDSGQAFTGEFLRLDKNNLAVFRLGGREFPYPLTRLLPADQRRVHELLEIRPDLPAAAPVPAPSVVPGAGANGPLTFAGRTLTPAEPLIVDVSLGADAAVLKPIRDAYNRPSTCAKLFLAVPQGFSPSAPRSYPVLIVSATTDGAGSSVGAAGAYVPDATDKGFVVLAVDGEFAKPVPAQHDTEYFRWSLVQAGLNALAREWPASKTWPVATGGVSGGGGYASHQAILLAAERRERSLLGIFLSVSNWNPTNFENDLRRAPFGPFRQTPIFMSVGENDSIATPAHTEGARAEMLRGGFKRLRYEKFPGGHELWGAHLRAALDWFLETGRKATPPTLPPA